MPDKTSVAVVFRIARGPDKESFTAAGELHRLATGWALTCRMAETAEGSEERSESEMMLIVRGDEIRMNRKGTVSQEQIFRTGEWRHGKIRTAYNLWDTEAYTHRIRAGLVPSGGIVEWDYELRMGGQELGRSSITLEIREEHRQ